MPRVTVCWSPAAGDVQEKVLDLALGATLADALAAAGVSLATGPIAEGDAGIWGQRAALDTVLKDGDRAEAWRPLRVDPNTARRERFALQGKRGTGLFRKK